MSYRPFQMLLKKLHLFCCERNQTRLLKKKTIFFVEILKLKEFKTLLYITPQKKISKRVIVKHFFLKLVYFLSTEKKIQFCSRLPFHLFDALLKKKVIKYNIFECCILKNVTYRNIKFSRIKNKIWGRSKKIKIS